MGQGLFIPFIVAPEEADSQCQFALLEGRPAEKIPVSAYGNVLVVVIESWYSEKHRVFNLSEAYLVSAIQSAETDEDCRVLAAAILQHGLLALVQDLAVVVLHGTVKSQYLGNHRRHCRNTVANLSIDTPPWSHVFLREAPLIQQSSGASNFRLGISSSTNFFGA